MGGQQTYRLLRHSHKNRLTKIWSLSWSRFPINASFDQSILQFRVPCIMRSKSERPSISINHWSTQLGVWIYLAIHTVSNSKIATSAAQCNIFTFIDSNDSAHCCYKNCAVCTLLNLQTVYTRAYVKIRIFTADESYILTRCHVCHISHCDAFV